MYMSALYAMRVSARKGDNLNISNKLRLTTIVSFVSSSYLGGIVDLTGVKLGFLLSTFGSTSLNLMVGTPAELINSTTEICYKKQATSKPSTSVKNINQIPATRRYNTQYEIWINNKLYVNNRYGGDSIPWGMPR